MIRSRFKLLLSSTALSLLLPASAQDSTNYPTIGEIVRFSDEANKILSSDAKIEVISSGYVWSEGPAWNKQGGFLAFSDVPENKVYKWVEGKGASLWIQPSGYTGLGEYAGSDGSNGLAFDDAGNLYSCECGDRRISILTKGQGKRTLADNYNGMRFNSPNDISLHSNGDIYFTDPEYGLPKPGLDGKETPYMGVYVIRKDGSVELVDDSLTAPNGIALSVDEKTLYVANSDRANNPKVYAYPIKKDGSFGKRRTFFNAQDYPALKGMSPDGMKFDARGNLWIGGIIGGVVLNPQGAPIALINSGEKISNCAFGGPDGSTLYMTSDTYIIKVETKVKGIGF
ncbi:SMP-30/gluconolactonase/LRE family protein [Pelagicoccus mobilis]|uniref:SMP-30/gluconolactonase/LRE family protein n=1 Tax=Pelagicoccus mobilis TaxID=415221 RepID=A0A934RUZ3_9BACT|nr:SMP-30/gluconolactonase/LRE family protein [Pelagicoccus mobilis]MBK1875311.1 SMP-30/gluconolactonase/LRE family protein [Pelagicoccus mobilis]